MASPIAISVDPEPITEGWSEYALDDGSTIWFKLVVTRVQVHFSTSDRSGPPIGIGVTGNPQVVVKSRPEDMGEAETVPDDVASSAKRLSIGFHSTNAEPWNYYRLVGAPAGLEYIKVRNTVINVYRIEGHYDKEGSPLYFVQQSSAGGPAPPDEVRAALQRAASTITSAPPTMKGGS